MKRSTNEWVQKAEGDFRSASKLAADPSPEWDHAAFFAQQCAEKYLKAVLNEADRGFPKTHDLVVLVALLDPPSAELAAMRVRLEMMTQLGVAVRYPGFFSDAARTREALDSGARVRRICRGLLGLPYED